MMTAKIQSDFLPLFGAWFDTANLAQSAGAQALASNAGNLEIPALSLPIPASL